jgi:hypothetical protein
MAETLGSSGARDFIEWADAVSREAKALDHLDGPCCLIGCRVTVAPLTGRSARRYPLDHVDPPASPFFSGREIPWPRH